MAEPVVPREPFEREPFGMPGHCYEIGGGWWHEPGTCQDVECRRIPCCGFWREPGAEP